MNSGLIFISHTTQDDEFVKSLRERLKAHRIPVWVDSRNLHGGSKLVAEIETAIEQARAFIAVISPNTVNSPWMRKEIQKALAVEKERTEDGYRVIPLLLPGIRPSALGTWFDEEPFAIPIALGPGGLDAMKGLLPSLVTGSFS